MKPRIEKKLSKRLAAIFQGLRTGQGVWIDHEVERSKHYAWPEKPLTPAQARYNREIRVSVNHVPSVGGEYCSYAGDCSDHYSMYEWYAGNARMEVFYAPEFDDMNFADLETPKSPEEEAHIEALWDKARRKWRRLRPGHRLMAHARGEALREWAASRERLPRNWESTPTILTCTGHFIERKEAAQ